MDLLTTSESLAPFAGGVLVPTMGALHPGHLALVRRAVGLGRGPVVVSVFVNPTQFNDPADFERYPKTLEADAEACDVAGAAAVFAPTVGEVYPPGRPPPVPDLPPAARAGLEDAHRPGHFEGVCQVVARLFELARPAAAVFGEKDWQQLVVVRAMSERDGLGVEIIAGETVREPDGLAMSSRNRFIPAGARREALGLRRALDAASDEREPGRAEAAMRRELAAAGIERPDYAAVRDAATLGIAEPGSGRPMRALVAARVGPVRLLDNAAWPGPVS